MAVSGSVRGFLGDLLIHNGHHVAGTMRFGEQYTFEDACEQLNFCKWSGINFLDAAELCIQHLYATEHHNIQPNLNCCVTLTDN